MPKNLMKVNIFEPYEFKDTPAAKSHYNGRTKSSPTSYSFHFDTKHNGGMFYIEWEQIPQFILDKTELYRSKLGYKRLQAPSAPELQRKINELFQAYMREYSEIKYTKKIGLSLRNNLGKIMTNIDELLIGIKYIIFYTKTYYNEDGAVFEEVNVKSKDTYDSEIKTNEYDVYEYSIELEDSIIGLQESMYNGMKEFIKNMGSEKEIISHFQSHNLLSHKKD